MKHSRIVILIIGFFLIYIPLFGLTHPTSVDKKNELQSSLKNIYRLYSQKNFDEALKSIDESISRFGSRKELLQLKFNILMERKQYADALHFVDAEIKKTGESQELLAAKFNILFSWEKYPDALEVALKKDKISGAKAPWDAINIAQTYIRLHLKEEALDALYQAARRGFINYRILTGENFSYLHQEPKFFEIIEMMKVNVGLGNPAKDFYARLISGEEFTLSSMKGKVLLLDFMSSWCEPCKNDIKPLNELFQNYKDKGFDIIAISLDSDIRRWETFVKSAQLNWKTICSGKVWDDVIVKRYGIVSLPTYWVIDKHGIVRGFDLHGDELKTVIEFLLKEKFITR